MVLLGISPALRFFVGGGGGGGGGERDTLSSFIGHLRSQPPYPYGEKPTQRRRMFDSKAMLSSCSRRASRHGTGSDGSKRKAVDV